MANPSPRALLPLAVVSVLAASGAGRGVAQGGSPEDAELVLAVASAGEADAEGERLGPVRQGRLRSGQARRWSLRLPAGACVL
ncbi:MAG: hypothetical protein CMH59_23645, partial [Myxococcales bacterium]|nr:hypothetical protein [Myxococcales bacterium]